MNTKSFILLLGMLVAQPAWLPAATNELTTALQKGLFEEEVNHDLNAAIRAYQAIATQFDRDRKLAATAIFRLGECYRKQGNTNDANALYERVLRDFPDQSALATLSRQNLTLLGGSPALATGSVLSSAARQEQKRLLQEEIKLSEQTLAEQQKMVQNGVASQETLRGTQRDILRLKRQLAALDIGSDPVADAAAEPAGGLVTSTEAEEVKRIQVMIKDSPDLINAVDEHSRRTPLHDAAAKGQLLVAQFLIANGADPAAKDGGGGTPLHLAAERGHRAIVELLVNRKASISAFDARGNTPLHAAAEKGFKSIVEFLLAKDAEANARTATGPTPLHLATANGFRAVAEVLLAHGADPNVVVAQFQSTGNYSYLGAPLHIATARGDAALAELLLANKAQVDAINSSGQMPLHVAAVAGEMEVAKLLLSHGAAVDATARGDVHSGWSPLALAVEQNQKQMVALLLEHKADANLRFDLIRGFNLSDINNNQVVVSGDKAYTSLLLATRRAYSEIVDLLLTHHADPNLQSGAGVFPLFAAVWYRSAEHERLIKSLLEHGADPNARTRDGQTMLMNAAAKVDKQGVELLLAHKADINAQDKRGQTALHCLAQVNWNSGADATALALALLRAGADANLQNEEGKTPLKFLLGRPPSEYERQMMVLLRQSGALEDLPRPDRIEICRPASGYSFVVFLKGTNGWNHFTLFELLGVQYEILTRYPQGERRAQFQGLPASALAYPDLAHVRLRRPGPDLKSWQPITVDLSAVLRSGECAKDPPLAWGDVIEIPELDHPLNEPWHGFSNAEAESLKQCLTREIEIVVHGQATKIKLSPSFNLTPLGIQLETKAPFWIKPVLLASNLLLASSDLSRVKVARVDAATGKKEEWILNCSESSSAPDLWLREGDMIEVPEKP